MTEPATPEAWDVARPHRPSRLPGVDMAGFRVPGPLAGGLRVVPHPAVMLILEFGPSASAVQDGTGRRLVGSLAAGPGFGAGGGVRAYGKEIETLQIRLPPTMATTLLDADPADLAGSMVPLDALWGDRETALLRERLNETSSWEARFTLIDELLAGRWEGRGKADESMAWAWHRMVTGRGLIRVDDLATELGWSRKRLWSSFRTHVGLPPKRAARLIRFDSAVHRMLTGEAPSQVAAAGGYFDQSHLHRDVMEFTGSTPARVVGEPFLTVDGRAWPAGARSGAGGGSRG
ncbi:helix-turn-helix domain-containing protein [Streptomyces sp. NPDC050658]|uniref:helix-turn-helix domain-containing protein n=1 Tax=unclassified Streptomyces TaxID=2593676 RepID=UPI003433D250